MDYQVRVRKIPVSIHTPKANNSLLPESSRLQIRRRRSSIALRNQRRPTRASPQTRPGNHRSRQGPLLLQESRRLLRMSPLSHSTSERWLLSRPHPRAQASDESGPEGGEGAKRGQSARCEYARREYGGAGSEEHGQDWTAWV